MAWQTREIHRQSDTSDFLSVELQKVLDDVNDICSVNLDLVIVVQRASSLALPGYSLIASESASSVTADKNFPTPHTQVAEEHRAVHWVKYNLGLLSYQNQHLHRLFFFSVGREVCMKFSSQKDCRFSGWNKACCCKSCLNLAGINHSRM